MHLVSLLACQGQSLVFPATSQPLYLYTLWRLTYKHAFEEGSMQEAGRNLIRSVSLLMRVTSTVQSAYSLHMYNRGEPQPFGCGPLSPGRSVCMSVALCCGIQEGNRRRKIEATDANAASSRSHAILEVTVCRSDRNHYRKQACRKKTLAVSLSCCTMQQVCP